MLEAIFIVLGAFVLVAEGGSLFAIWNVLPLIIGYLLLRRARRKKFTPMPEILYNVCSTGVIAAGHLAWITDFQNTATGSSTSALLFVLLPVWAILLGGLAFLTGWVFSRRRC